MARLSDLFNLLVKLTFLGGITRKGLNWDYRVLNDLQENWSGDSWPAL